jgi:uncharacterized membrane protein SirB2
VIALKTLHVTCVALTFLSFTVRAHWMLRGSPLLSRRWVRIVPHGIDTILLLSGIALMFVVHQYPVTDNWLSAKLIGLVLYIGLGTVALKRGRKRSTRLAALAGAYAVFFYIVAVALSREPIPFLA